MYQILKGKNKTLEEIAHEHYVKLNYRHDFNPLVDSPISYLLELISEYKKGRSSIKKNKHAFFNEFVADDYKILKNIFLFKPNQFAGIIKSINKSLDDKGLSFDEVKLDFEAIFRYNNWRQTERCKWLFTEIGISVCPYCNNEEVYKTEGSNKLFFDYDHYFAQAKYPYLALSFYNLIPSCHKCNSMAKGFDEFSIRTHLHPYLNNYDQIAKFALSDIPIRPKDPFDIEINCNKLELKKKLDKYNLDLELIDRYNSNHGKAKVEYVLLLKDAYTDTKILELINDPLLSDVNNREDAIKMLAGIPIIESDILNILYGKLVRDMGVIFGIYAPTPIP